ncbi:cytochrome P450 [Nocardia sp. NPDC059246]|uniref:cytochrome P450 n=1 Tax=unclassified Nocardia TaxID=2637762 RepID=UPI0036C02142
MPPLANRRLDIGVLDPDVYANGNPATYGLPLDQYAYLRENEPVYLQEFNDPLLIDRVRVISRYEDISAIDRDPQTFAFDRGHLNIWTINPIDPRSGGQPAMLTADIENHKRQRRVISRGFTPNVVRRLEEKFRDYARTVVDEALAKGTLNFVTDVAHAMPMEALGDVLGVPPAERAQFFNWVDRFAAPFDTRITPSLEAVLEAIGNLIDYSTDLAARKRLSPENDVISKMVQADADDPLSEDEMLGNIVLLASGAAESTRTALSHGMHQLMRDPDQMAWLRAHADDIPVTALQEFVRISTPFLHFVRTVTKDIELHGHPISEGERVCILLGAGNFDPEVFRDADVFDLSRDTDPPHLSFGRGPHSCLGKHVAVLEMKILLEELLQRTKDIRPAGEISYVRDVFARGVYELPITITPA